MWSSTENRVRRLRARVLAILTVAGALAAGGCATTTESDIPWNSPQPWEGTILLPGLPQQD